MQTTQPEKILMQGIHVELTPGLQGAIREKFGTLLQHNSRIIRIKVRLHKDQQLGRNHHFTATAQVELRGPDLVATAEDRDAYTALDQLSQRLDELLQVRHERRKERRHDLHAVDLAAPLPKIEPAPSR
jgi:putative sigma-54 modulation protein